MVSCVDVQFCRRDSSGCVDVTDVEGEGCNEVRSVSWRPGADGAPRSRSLLFVDESLDVLVLDVLVGWVDEGARRRDCRMMKSVWD